MKQAIISTISTNRIATVIFVLGTNMALMAQGQAPQNQPTARGIYLGGAKLGVTAEIEIERDGKRGMVPANFEFKSGDRFWLHVTVNQPSYVYVLNRTYVGPPEQATKGIKLMAEADRKAGKPPADSYSLVYPGPHVAAKLIKAGVPTTIPGNGQYFVMDQTPGAEKLLVRASATRWNTTSYFDGSSGKLLAPGNTTDSSESVLGRLNTELVQTAENTDTEEPPKARSIAIIANPPAGGTKPAGPAIVAGPPGPPRTSVGVTRQPGKPMLLELTLLHTPR